MFNYTDYRSNFKILAKSPLFRFRRKKTNRKRQFIEKEIEKYKIKYNTLFTSINLNVGTVHSSNIELHHLVAKPNFLNAKGVVKFRLKKYI